MVRRFFEAVYEVFVEPFIPTLLIIGIAIFVILIILGMIGADDWQERVIVLIIGIGALVIGIIIAIAISYAIALIFCFIVIAFAINAQ